MSQIVTKNATLFVESQGTGRPVVLIHGWPLSGESWAHQVPALVEAGFRTITYDRRGFGRSSHPASGFDYDTLTADLAAIIDQQDLRDLTLVGFSMGGGEVARYVSTFGEDRLRSVVFASAVPPFLMKSADNPDGPLTPEVAKRMEDGLKADRATFFDGFTKDFFSANKVLKVSEAERQKAITLCEMADQTAALGCMKAFGTTDFRKDLTKVTVPTLVLHGDSDAIVPFEGSGKRTHAAIAHSELTLIADAPHGVNASHVEEFNASLIRFLKSK